MSKLIMLNGAAAVGKTTIANRYAADHPLTLNFAGDVLIEMISDWRASETEARRSVFSMTLAAVEAYLKTEHDVIVQYLLVDPDHAEVFAQVAEQTSAAFYEIYLEVDKETAVRRLLQRGKWGEPHSPDLTDADIPEIEDLYDCMVEATAQRPHTISIPVREGDIEGTYQQFCHAVMN